KGIGELTDIQKETYFLYVFRGWGTPRIASKLNKSVGAVSKSISSARSCIAKQKNGNLDWNHDVRVRREIGKLPPKTKLYFELRVLQGLSVPTIAAQTGKSYETITSAVCRAKNIIHQRIANV